MAKFPERLSDFRHTVLHLESMVSTYLVQMDQDRMLKFSGELATRFHSNVQPGMVMDILDACPEFQSTIYPDHKGKLVTFQYGLEGSRVLYVPSIRITSCTSPLMLRCGMSFGCG